MIPATIEQTFQKALEHHRAGQLPQAETLYRQILAQQPRHAWALHLLGVIAYQAGQLDRAVDLIGQAIALQPDFPEAYSNQGEALRAQGHPDKAIAAFRRAIALKPDYPEAHYNLANVLKDQRQFLQAIPAYRQAIALNPNLPEAHCNLAEALKAAGQLDDAIASYRRALTLKPGHSEAWNNLGIALQYNGQLDEAITAYRRAIAINPKYVHAYSNQGEALRAQGKPTEAIAALRQAIALQPDMAEAYNNLGIALADTGQLDAAIAAYRQALTLAPHYAQVHNNLGNALRDKGQFDDAIAALRQALILNSAYPEAHSNLANTLCDQGLLDEAIAAYRQAIALKPGYSDAHRNLGNALKDAGQLDDAIASARRAVAFQPNDSKAHSNLILYLNYHAAYDARARADEAARWNLRHAEPLKIFSQPHPNDCNPHRRLRIGYVSSDFWTHASAYFLVPLLEQHDPRQVELFCYADVLQPDAITTRLQPIATWRNTLGLSDENLAHQIRHDQIDILVDLKLHTGHNRLLAFARKPAPVQATWLGYPGTTGLTTIDYRLSDPYLDPPGADESVYCEKTIRLPDCFWCYDPLADGLQSVGPLPALANHFITFGCLNNFCKINEPVLLLWAKILNALEGSRLLLLAKQGRHRDRAAEFLSRQGIMPQRIEFLDFRPRSEYLQQYRRIDLGLDTFPCNGHTTSLDSFWMGVPVVTLVGQTTMGRAGWSQLSNLQLTALAARTPDQFAQIAIDLAKDLPRLAELRRTLRPRMEQSPLMNAPRFARNIETAFRQMWRNWCTRETP